MRQAPICGGAESDAFGRQEYHSSRLFSASWRLFSMLRVTDRLCCGLAGFISTFGHEPSRFRHDLTATIALGFHKTWRLLCCYPLACLCIGRPGTSPLRVTRNLPGFSISRPDGSLRCTT